MSTPRLALATACALIAALGFIALLVQSARAT